MLHRKSRLLAIVCALCAVTACSKSASTPPASATASTSTVASASTTPATASTGSGNWIANGTTACEKYLTSDVVATIWIHPAGQSKAFDTRGASSKACIYQSANTGNNITITLDNAGPESFDAVNKYRVKPVPLANVGDKASLTADGIDAVKGDNRTCHINAYGNGGSIKLSREALGQKFGEICNKLFALP